MFKLLRGSRRGNCRIACVLLCQPGVAGRTTSVSSTHGRCGTYVCACWVPPRCCAAGMASGQENGGSVRNCGRVRIPRALGGRRKGPEYGSWQTPAPCSGAGWVTASTRRNTAPESTDPASSSLQSTTATRRAGCSPRPIRDASAIAECPASGSTVAFRAKSLNCPRTWRACRRRSGPATVGTAIRAGLFLFPEGR